VNPFTYPKNLHVRAYTPKQYKRYQTYKKILRIEFSRKCVYCLMPDTMKGVEAFGVDHYKPKEKFHLLSTHYQNLYYCCNSCNSAKNDYWPPSKALEKTKFIPNPCEHRMFEHLRFRGGEVESRSAAGEFTKDLLDLNDPDVVSYRKLLIDTISLWELKCKELEQIRKDLQNQHKAGKLSAADLAVALSEVEPELEKIDINLKLLSGTP